MLAIAGQHHIADTTLPMPEDRLLNVFFRNGDAFRLIDVADVARRHGFAHRLSDLLFETPHKPLAVAHRFILACEPAVDDMQCHLCSHLKGLSSTVLPVAAPGHRHHCQLLLRTRRYHSQSRRTCLGV
ncbi:hypothetical protein SDC9_212095 [bioreactor metagenome]|uniref:Uncharacterized protein n=1 Tax=bioreactor metagenome TaxID=1076179 RepID=A0A645JZ73_9ZZZZ